MAIKPLFLKLCSQLMDSFRSQVSLQSSPEKTDSQTPPPSDSDPMNNSPTYHVIIDIPTELTVLLAAAAAVEKDFKRQCKMANSFIAVFLTISASLIVTISVPKDPDWVFLSAIDPILAFTSLVCNFGLLFYSLRSNFTAELAKVQGAVLGFSAVLLLFAVLSRLALLFPWQLLLPLAAIVVMLIALQLILLLYFTQYKK